MSDTIMSAEKFAKALDVLCDSDTPGGGIVFIRDMLTRDNERLKDLIRELIEKADVPDVLVTDEWRELVKRAKAVTNG